MVNNMIPKIIHYCWFGRNPLPELAKKCIASWKKRCPDYEIIEWNENNYDIASAPLYVRQAYEAKKWAFVTDYVRLWVVYEYGGIYLDTDVELLRKLDELLKYSAYFGFEDTEYIATGLGFGAEKGSLILQEMMDEYHSISFIKSDGSIDSTACPVRNTQVLLRHGLKQNDSRQVLDGGILILPRIVLSPIDYHSGIYKKSWRSFSVHWFAASWQTEQETQKMKEWQKKRREEIHQYTLTHLHCIAAQKLLGMERYLKVRSFLRGERRKNKESREYSRAVYTPISNLKAK